MSWRARLSSKTDMIWSSVSVTGLEHRSGNRVSVTRQILQMDYRVHGKRIGNMAVAALGPSAHSGSTAQTLYLQRSNISGMRHAKLAVLRPRRARQFRIDQKFPRSKRQKGVGAHEENHRLIFGTLAIITKGALGGRVSHIAQLPKSKRILPSEVSSSSTESGSNVSPSTFSILNRR